MGRSGRPPRNAATKNAASNASAGNVVVAPEDHSKRRETRSSSRLLSSDGAQGPASQNESPAAPRALEFKTKSPSQQSQGSKLVAAKAGVSSAAATSLIVGVQPVTSAGGGRGRRGHEGKEQEESVSAAAPSTRAHPQRRSEAAGGGSEGKSAQQNGNQGATSLVVVAAAVAATDGGGGEDMASGPNKDGGGEGTAAADEVASSRAAGALKRKGKETATVVVKGKVERVVQQRTQEPPEVVELDGDDDEDDEETLVKAPSPKRARGGGGRQAGGRGKGKAAAAAAAAGGRGANSGRTRGEAGRAGKEHGRENLGRAVHPEGEEGAGPSSPVRRLPRQRSPPPTGQEIGSAFPGEPSNRRLAHHHHEEGNEEAAKDAPFMDAVVKVFCVHTEPNFSLPWQRKRQFSSNSSGFIIGGKRVLTNAHSVEHHTQVKVKRRGSDTKYLASVLAIGTECDIAMLTVEDESFWEGVEPLQFGPLPRLQDSVVVVGYPIGGDTISVTSGVVSRIEVLSYVHGSAELLGVQIDAAINSGNSGGPAFSGGECVGIAFQSLKHEDAENIGYIIPTPVIKHFITDYERHNEFTGFPFLGFEWQKMENPDLRKALGMGPTQKGVRVRRVQPTSSSAKVLEPSDIIISFDGIKIANDGTVPFRHGERIGFSYLVSQKYNGESATMEILRKGSLMTVNIELGGHTHLVPVHIRGRPPSYYIIAGLVFTAVTVPYLRSEYGKDYDYDAPVKLLDKVLHSMTTTPGEQVIVISQVLVADINIGYEDIVNIQVKAVNGTPLRNLKQLAELVEACNESFLQFNLEYQQLVVMDTKAAKAATPEILETHCIPSAMSEDLKAKD